MVLIGLGWLAYVFVVPGLLDYLRVQANTALNTVLAWVFVLAVLSITFGMFFGERGRAMIATAWTQAFRFLFKCLEGVLRLLFSRRRD